MNELYIAFTRSYAFSMPGLFFCIRNAMFLVVKWNLLYQSYADFKCGVDGEMT